MFILGGKYRVSPSSIIQNYSSMNTKKDRICRTFCRFISPRALARTTQKRSRKKSNYQASRVSKILLITFVVGVVGLSRFVMETTTTTTTTASIVKGSSSSPSFLDDFTLHLASHLLGPERLLFEFDQVMKKDQQKTKKKRNPTSAISGIHSDDDESMSSSLTISLYWRSNMLLPDTASVVQSLSLTETNDAEDPTAKPPLLFVDVIFSFDGSNDASTQQQRLLREEKMKPPIVSSSPHPSISMVFGVFLLSQHNGIYIQGSPMTMVQLEHHAKSVGLDLHSAPAKAMAGMMAEALMQQTTNPPRVLLLSEHNNRKDKDQERHDEPIPESTQQQQQQQSVLLELYYKDVEGIGTVQLNDSKRSSGFDSLGMSLFCRDLFGSSSSRPRGTSSRSDSTGHDKHHEPFATTSTLQEKFDRWWKQASIPITTRVEGAAAHESRNSTVNDSTTITTGRATTGGKSSLRSSSSSRPTKVVGLSGYSKLSHLHKRRKKDKNMNPFSTLQK
jgi:hypothetical protein